MNPCFLAILDSNFESKHSSISTTVRHSLQIKWWWCPWSSEQINSYRAVLSPKSKRLTKFMDSSILSDRQTVTKSQDLLSFSWIVLAVTGCSSLPSSSRISSRGLVILRSLPRNLARRSMRSCSCEWECAIISRCTTIYSCVAQFSEGQQGDFSSGAIWRENLRFRKCDAARRLPPNAEPIACGQLISSRQQMGGADKRTVNKTRAPTATGIITLHLPCFVQPI